MALDCHICSEGILARERGEPYLSFKDKVICFGCYIDLIPAIYKMAGMGDGGIIHLEFKEMLKSQHNRKGRTPIPHYQKTLKELLQKYKFSCVNCGATEKLTIDHIKPVSKGGTHIISNLQILCKSCNSKKGARYE